MTMEKEIKIPVLRPIPTLLEVLRMEQGRLALYTFGAPTDCVFDVITAAAPPAPRPPQQ